MDVSGRLEKEIERRDFLGMAALGAFFIATGTAVLGMLRLPRPSVLPEPSQRYRIGIPATIAVGETVVPPGRNVFVFHDEKGFYAISAVCTHLGCIVRQASAGFNCPCHGSRFDSVGRVIGGPAPRPLDWYALFLAPDGQLVVDEGAKVKVGTYLKI